VIIIDCRGFLESGMSGVLYIVATPIGNLKDITLRAIDILKEVDLICVEDTRVSRRLLDAHQIVGKSMWSVHEHNEKGRSDAVLERLEAGEKVALLSDAGTPVVSDPGFPLIRTVTDAGIPVEVIPGPCAAVAALSASGLPPEPFTFVGFPPKKTARAQKWIESRLRPPGTFIVYIPARDAESFVALLAERWPGAPVVLARELTKVHETYHRATASTFSLEESACRGEATLVVDLHIEEDEETVRMGLVRDLKRMYDGGFGQKDAISAVSILRGVSRSAVKGANAILKDDSDGFE